MTQEQQDIARDGLIRFVFRGDVSGPVRIVILDVSGRVVVSYDDVLSAGGRELTWNGRDDRASVRAGVYFARITDRQGRQANARAIVIR